MNKNDLMVIEIKKPKIPKKWDFKAADKTFDKYIRDWRRLSIDVVSELWVFYQKLKVQGRRTDLSTNVEKLPTWIDWLETKGIAAPTPLRHFKALGWLKAKKIDKEKIPRLPKGKYNIIYADPPWQYHVGEQHAEAGTVQAKTLSTYYPSMTLEEICELPISELAADNAVLFLWTTSPVLEEAFSVIFAWGFKYKASFIWDKIKHNVGHYNSVRHEILLIATRGSYLPDHKKLYDSVQSIERTKHSRKPKEFIKIIDDIYRKGKRIELFRRGKKIKNWEAWGHE